MFLSRVGMRAAARVFRRAYATEAAAPAARSSNEMAFTFAAPYQASLNSGLDLGRGGQ